MTLSELVYNVLNIAKAGGVPNDDSRLNERLIKFWIRYYRAIFLNEFTDYGKDISPEIVQDLGCVQLTDIDKAECEVKVGCTIKKAVIPQLVDLPNNRSLVFVGYIDKQKPIPMSDAETFYFTQYRRFTNKDIRGYMIGNKIYISSPSNRALSRINVRGVFENPEAIVKKDDQGNVVCYDPMTDQYPIPEGMVAKIMESILAKELTMSLNTKFDNINNANDDTARK